MLTLSALLLVVTPAPTDWPTWRGPDGTNVSTETAWSNTGKPAWTAQVGTGYTTPVVARGRVYVTGYLASEEDPKVGIDRVSCLDANSGELLWKDEYPAKAYDNEHAGGALSTATVHEGVVYVPNRDGEVRAYEAKGGALLWEVDLKQRHGLSTGRYGFASSPYVHDGAIVLCASKAVCLELVSGETRWISAEGYDANYSTVRPISVGERECFVVFGGEGLCLVDAADGSHVAKQVWRKTPRNVEGATPIVLGTRVFVSTAYEQGAALYDFGGDEPVELWRNRAMRNKMAGCTFWDGHFYGFDESMLKCLDLEGNEQWRQRGLGQGALMIADGRILSTTSRGALVVAKASPAGFEELSRTQVLEQGGVFWAAPVLCDGRIYVRGSYGSLACRDHRESGTGSATGEAEATADLPSPAVLAARHLAASKHGAAGVPAVRFEGKLFVKALGLDNVDALWELGPGGRWHARMGLPPAMPGHIDRFYNGTDGWETNPFRGSGLIEGNEGQELTRTKGQRDLFDPLPEEYWRHATSAGLHGFHGLRCFRVDVKFEKWSRQVFFDARTGLYAGRTADDESTVVLGDWREVDGKLYPFQRTVYDSDTGQEQRWVFERMSLDCTEDADVWVLPEALAKKKAEEKDK